MNQKNTFDKIAGIIFLIVGLVHLLRVINGWEIVIGGMAIPMYASYIGVIAAWLLAYFGLRKTS